MRVAFLELCFESFLHGVDVLLRFCAFDEFGDAVQMIECYFVEFLGVVGAEDLVF